MGLFIYSPVKSFVIKFFKIDRETDRQTSYVNIIKKKTKKEFEIHLNNMPLNQINNETNLCEAHRKNKSKNKTEIKKKKKKKNWQQTK